MQITGRKLLEAAKRVESQWRRDHAGDAKARAWHELSDAEIAELIAAGEEARKEAHRERMRRYYRERRAGRTAPRRRAGKNGG